MHDEANGTPSAVHIEVAVLGAMLLYEDALEEGSQRLDAHHFSLDSHQRIFRSILSLKERGLNIDYTTVQQDLIDRREFDSIGGLPYLLHITDGIPRNFNIESYVRIVIEKSDLRELMLIWQSGLNDASDQGERSAEIAARTISRMREVIESGGDSRMERMGDFLNQHYTASDSVFAVSKRDTGIPSGWPQFDEYTNGFHRGELTIVAARPSMGKTAWVGSLIDNVCRAQGKTTAVFILEQAKRSLMSRLLCGRAIASLKRFSKGESTAVERQYIAEAMDEYRRTPLYWDDQSHMTCTGIRARVSRLRRELGPEEDLLVIVDQLNHIGISDIFRKGMQRDEIGGAKALALKKMAKELDVPVVLMAQLSRGVKNNKDFRPTLADLAESGQLEQHADNVDFLHRPEYYDRTDESLHGKGEFIFAKQRDGPTGSCMVQYIADSCRWKDDPKAQTARLGDQSGPTPW